VLQPFQILLFVIHDDGARASGAHRANGAR
jgi:hypothetical protein